MTPTESPTTVGIVDQRSTNSSSPSNAVSTGSNHVLQHNKAENVIFVGNLSFFCEEKHLYDLFHQYSHVDHVRILQNSNKTKSLMYGFVTVTGDAEAKELVHMLDNHLFMGRRLKVAISNGTSGDSRPASPPGDGLQVYVTFNSYFERPRDIEMAKPTECFLRKLFISYGRIVDVTVKVYKIHKIKHHQEGYAFLIFDDKENAARVVREFSTFTFQGIDFTCSLTQDLPQMQNMTTTMSNLSLVRPAPMTKQRSGSSDTKSNTSTLTASTVATISSAAPSLIVPNQSYGFAASSNVSAPTVAYMDANQFQQAQLQANQQYLAAYYAAAAMNQVVPGPAFVMPISHYSNQPAMTQPLQAQSPQMQQQHHVVPQTMTGYLPQQSVPPPPPHQQQHQAYLNVAMVNRNGHMMASSQHSPQVSPRFHQQVPTPPSHPQQQQPMPVVYDRTPRVALTSSNSPDNMTVVSHPTYGYGTQQQQDPASHTYSHVPSTSSSHHHHFNTTRFRYED